MSGPAFTNITYSDTVIAAGWDGRKFGVGITSLEIRTLASFRIMDYTIREPVKKKSVENFLWLVHTLLTLYWYLLKKVGRKNI